MSRLKRRSHLCTYRCAWSAAQCERRLSVSWRKRYSVVRELSVLFDAGIISCTSECFPPASSVLHVPSAVNSAVMLSLYMCALFAVLYRRRHQRLCRESFARGRSNCSQPRDQVISTWQAIKETKQCKLCTRCSSVKSLYIVYTLQTFTHLSACHTMSCKNSAHYNLVTTTKKSK